MAQTMRRASPTLRATRPETSSAPILSANLKGTFFLSQAVIPAMREAGGGSIINAGTVPVNNAGISIETPVADHEVATIQSIIDTNLLGPMLTTRQAIRRMSTERGGTGGVIVNISSISAIYGGLPGDAVYAGTKGGIASFTPDIAKEVGQEGIRVCCVRPGLIRTEIWDDGMGQDQVIELGKKAVPMGRVGEVDEIASATLWLASDEAAYMTGAIVSVSGGRETYVRT